MRHLLPILTVLGTTILAVGQSASLTDQQVLAAIAAQNEAMKAVVWTGHSLPGHFRIAVSGPLAVISQQAARAAKQFKPFAAADVPESGRRPLWTIVVVPTKPAMSGGRWNVTPPANDVLLQKHGVTDIATVMRPTSIMLTPETWGNAMGATFEGRGATATFDPSTLPDGDLDVIVVTATNPRRYELSAKDRLKIQ